MKYQREATTISYFVFEDFGLSLGLPETVNVGEIELHMGEEEDTNCAAWKKEDLVYFILTAEDRSELIEYARQCIELFQNVNRKDPARSSR